MSTIEEALDGLNGPREVFRPMLQAEAILNRICGTAELLAQQREVPPWVIISEMTSHGSGVSNAIYQVYRNSGVD